MRLSPLPSTLMLMAAFSTLAATANAQSGSTNLGTDAGSVLSAPVETFSDASAVYNSAPVYSDAPAYSYQDATPQYEVYQPTAQPMAAAPKNEPTPYKGLYYANDFSYLTDSYDGPIYWGDNWKNLDVGQNGKLSIGGELRYRYHSEQGQGRTAAFPTTGFNDTDNDFGLLRLRLFADYKATDRLRFYIEGIYADVVHANDEYLPRGPIDRNFGDITNLFADVKISDSTLVRIGRQELLYGAQRLVSPLDWANTRRTFQGIRTISKFDNWNVDAFWTQPVPVLFNEFDRGNENQDFYGTYMTYTGLENSKLDLYYLGFDNDDVFNIDTFGTRLYGGKDAWLWDIEAAIQTGTQQALGQNIEAYAVTAGIGRKFDRPWKPTLWFYYDYASGNESGTPGTFEQFNQLFPLAHKYLGFIDAVARANIAAPNVQLTVQPTKKLKLIAWWHNFQAAQIDSPIPGVATSAAQNTTSRDLGNELDFVANLNVNPRTNIFVGYSHFFRGDRVIGTRDADFFYLQLTKRF